MTAVTVAEPPVFKHWQLVTGRNDYILVVGFLEFGGFINLVSYILQLNTLRWF